MNERERPNPDVLLAEIQRDERAIGRGQLKIFFGMCPGVGKTYSMLRSAQQRRADGVDVAVGFVETHGRAETEALLAGLEVVPRKQLAYRGVTLTEMDIDAVLARRPRLVLVDELAHTNAPGSRHPKRYQDVLELLEAGIDVYTTLNVQHLESRVDVVQQVTGVVVRETLPDSVVDKADEIELIDLTPEQLRKRLAEGKVYLGERAAAASESFFREENLTALREMALRCTTERVDRELRGVMRAKRIGGAWQSGQRLAVAVGPSPFSGSLIRWTRRIAAAMDASWVAIYVETSDALSEEAKARLTKHLSLARQLGAEVVMTRGDDVAEAVLEAAREERVTQLVVGRPEEHPLWQFLRGGSMVSKLIRRGGDINIHVVPAEQGGPRPARVANRLWTGPVGRECAWSAAAVGAVTVAAWLLQGLTGYQPLGLLYLLSVLMLATFMRRRAVLFAAALSALLWDYLFIPPPFTFRIASLQDQLTLGMYFVVTMVVGRVTSRLRTREAAEHMREQRTQALNRLLEGVAASTALDEGLRRALAEVDTVFHAQLAVLLDAGDGKQLQAAPHPASTFEPDEREFAVAAWAFAKRQAAGRFTDTLPNAAALYLPLATTKNRLGVLGVNFVERTTLPLDERELLETFADQIAAMIERYWLLQEAGRTQLAEESEKLYKTLLDSVSHELKTPLAVIQSATGELGLVFGLVQETRRARPFLDEIQTASRRLIRIVDNLLSMTRIESGRYKLEPVWCDVDEIIASARQQVGDLLEKHHVSVRLPETMPSVRVDYGFVEQGLANLLANAAMYSPEATEIRIAAHTAGRELVLRVSDEGPGLTPDVARRVFEKFFRGPNVPTGGIGLGLSIVRGLMRALGGEVTTENNPVRGASFTLRIPVELRQVPPGS